MAFRRKVDSGEAFKFEKVGQSLTGYYLGSRDFEGDYGPTKAHLFQTEKGVLSVIGQSHLTSLLKDETPGVLMQITYAGTKKSKNGKPMKVYNLDIDDEQVLDPTQVQTISAQAEATEETSDDIEDDEVSDEETQADEIKPSRPSAPARAASAPAPQQRRAVADLLSKSRAR